MKLKIIGLCRGLLRAADIRSIWTGNTTDEAKAETRKRIVESPQPVNNWRPMRPTTQANNVEREPTDRELRQIEDLFFIDVLG